MRMFLSYALVGSNDTISNMLKFHYLKSCISDASFYIEMLELIAMYTLSHASFVAAPRSCDH